jgi:type IV secretion system protein VirB9
MKTLIALVLALSTSAGVWAEQLPTRGIHDSRIRVAAYDAEEVYRLYGFVGYQIDLEFEPGETYAGIGGGDLEGLTFGAHENHLLLKPKAVNVGTNLTVFTTRRHYHFEYSASDRKPNSLRDEVIYAVRFTYPDSLPKNAGPTTQELIDADFAQAPAHRARNIDYWFCGHESLRPTAASDDGMHTRLTFGAKAELPAIFVRNDDGTESLLNFSMQDGDIILHRVARQFVLRRGRLTGCIVNKGFSGGGERLESGTVAPDVKRVPKATPP